MLKYYDELPGPKKGLLWVSASSPSVAASSVASANSLPSVPDDIFKYDPPVDVVIKGIISGTAEWIKYKFNSLGLFNTSLSKST